MSGRGRFSTIVALATSALLGITVAAPARAAVDPPFDGTIGIDPDIITATDPTAFETLEYGGQGERRMFDRRVNAFVTVDAHIFAVDFRDGPDTEVQVNPEFDRATAQTMAVKYARVVGQLPPALRKDVDAVWVQGGNQLFGGGNDSLLIHTEQSEAYEAAGILEETLVHEAAHTSLDAEHAAAPGWLAAQQDDPTFISTYARDFPGREDVAESILPYLALRYRGDRIDDSLADTIRTTMPNRSAYLDSQGLALGSFAPARRERSRGALDGWVREARAGSGVGARRDVDGSVLRIGAGARGREYRAVLSFDTSSLPDRAVITDLTVRLHQTGVVAGDPVGDLGGFRTGVAKDGFGAPALRSSDFAAPATRTLSPAASFGAGGLIDLDLVGARTAVSRTGLTQVRLRFAQPHQGDSVAQFLMLASGDASRQMRPQLVVQYGTR